MGHVICQTEEASQTLRRWSLMACPQRRSCPSCQHHCHLEDYHAGEGWGIPARFVSPWRWTSFQSRRPKWELWSSYSKRVLCRETSGARSFLEKRKAKKSEKKVKKRLKRQAKKSSSKEMKRKKEWEKRKRKEELEKSKEKSKKKGCSCVWGASIGKFFSWTGTRTFPFGTLPLLARLMVSCKFACYASRMYFTHHMWSLLSDSVRDGGTRETCHCRARLQGHPERQKLLDGLDLLLDWALGVLERSLPWLANISRILHWKPFWSSQ